MKAQFFLAGLLVILMACNSGNPGAGKTAAESLQTKEMAKAAAPKVNVDSLVAVLEAQREKIEGTLKTLRKTTIPTKELREQIKQKWSQIEYSIDNGQVVRIITHPYRNITSRTEDFYFRDGRKVKNIPEARTNARGKPISTQLTLS